MCVCGRGGGREESCFCNLVTSCMRTKNVHIVTVATEGGCFSNIRAGMCSVIF